jgi:hypothetical protein
MKHFTTLAGAALFVLATCTGATSAPELFTMSVLTQACGSANASERSICLAYATAVRDSFLAMAAASKNTGVAGICLSANEAISPTDMITYGKDAARSVSNANVVSAANLMLWGLRSRFPCEAH